MTSKDIRAVDTTQVVYDIGSVWLPLSSVKGVSGLLNAQHSICGPLINGLGRHMASGGVRPVFYSSELIVSNARYSVLRLGWHWFIEATQPVNDIGDVLLISEQWAASEFVVHIGVLRVGFNRPRYERVLSFTYQKSSIHAGVRFGRKSHSDHSPYYQVNVANMTDTSAVATIRVLDDSTEVIVNG